MMKKFFLTILFFAIALITNAQIDKILGEWCSVDDKTGEVTGVILFYKGDNGLYYGKTTHVYEKGKELFDPQYIGMVLVKDFKLEDGHRQPCYGLRKGLYDLHGKRRSHRGSWQDAS